MYYEWDMGKYSDLITIPIVEINLTSWQQIAELMHNAQSDPSMNLTFRFDYSGMPRQKNFNRKNNVTKAKNGQQ